jgi:peptidoglycan hydrolase-like protein with peptidoglycan-binding domain
MKKSILALLFVSSISFSFAAPATCLDFSTNLSRGAESNLVLSIQNFLFTKGFLKVTPNGYFGPSTFAAVKAYQATNGFAQVGNTGPMTRAAIKRDSCTASVGTDPSTVAPLTQQATTSINISAPVQSTGTVAPLPALSYLDLVTIFAGGQTDWTFDVHGSNFSSTTNTIYFRNTGTRKIYTIGIFPSVDLKTITLPKNIGSTVFSCGAGCNEMLPPGSYEVSVGTPGGQTSGQTMQVQSFTSYAQTGATQGALPANVSHVKFGSLSFSPSVAVLLKSVLLVAGTTTMAAGGYSNVSLVDSSINDVYQPNTDMSPFQSKILDAYVDTINSNAPGGTVMANFTIVVQDYIGKKDTTFTSAPFLVTIAGIL